MPDTAINSSLKCAIEFLIEHHFKWLNDINCMQKQLSYFITWTRSSYKMITERIIFV